MNAPQHRKRLVIATLATLLIASAFHPSFGHGPRTSKKPIEATIIGLLQKRRATLSQLAKVQMEAYRRGSVEAHAVVQPLQDLLFVELELAANHEEQIQLLQKSVQMVTELEKVAEAKYRAGKGSVADVLKCQADRLKAETFLLLKRQSVKTEKKK